MEFILQITAGFFLLVCAGWDWRTKTVPFSILILFIVVGCAIRLFYGGFTITESNSMVFGLVFIVSSILSKGNIGIGDGFVLLALGIYLNGQALFVVLAGALFLTLLFAGGCLLLKKSDWKTAYPFLPFLFGSYLWWVIL